jgi:hypothetical protein
VRRDIAQIMHELHKRCRVSISATDTLPITLETNEASLQAGINSLSAAALRALADQVVPEGGNFIAVRIRAAILTIATELEGDEPPL